ncbi:hypothetical protein [Aquimarina intermedia]|uniref:Uncharacterized protein n=1 Tax=Aquimarina intermedia TaxID=350814 RepID=A0A5S5CCB8_9FLAO|nr:hypothetical protein [Aquimarina intermedia]TYP76142.1 hypothetical protein BD809_102359 [Aquimarina intermedia]
MSSQEETSLSFPDIYPVAPEVANLMKYGDIPVNLAAGKIDYSVPIYTIKVGDFEYPISLSYNYSGLVTEEDVGSVGLGWTLNGTGLITRQINGKPDESASFGYIGQDMNTPSGIGFEYVEPFYKQQLSNNLIEQLFRNAANGQWDTEPDKFMIKAGDTEGSFYLNARAIPVFMPQKNYKVTFDNNFSGKITVDNDLGIIYEFEDIEYTTQEGSMSTSLINYTSNWYLSKIRFPNSSKEISFFYDNYTYHKTGYRETKTTRSGSSCEGLANPSITSDQSDALTQPKLLKKIVFPDGELRFFNKTDSNGSMLEKVELLNTLSDTISQFNYKYSNTIPSAKKTLQAITKSKGNSILPYFNFEYYGTLPEVLDYRSQDHWGFYNGKNNKGLLEGDRSISFKHARIGALNKIVDPTKGYTKINYEQNQVPFETSNIDNGTDDSPPEFDASIMIELDSDDYSEISNFLERTVAIPSDINVFSVQLFAGCYGNNGLIEASVAVSGGINNYSSTQNNRDLFVSLEQGGEGSNSNPNEVAKKEEHGLGIFSYTGVGDPKVTITLNTTSTSNTRARAYAFINYVARKPLGTILFSPIGGIRIASSVDYSTAQDSIYKGYKYLKKDGKSSGLLSNQSYLRATQIYTGCKNCKFTTIHASSNLPFSSFQGNSVFYSRVEILSNGNDRNGKQVQYFSGGGSGSGLFLPTRMLKVGAFESI